VTVGTATVIRLRFTKGIRHRASRRHLRVPLWFGRLRPSTEKLLAHGKSDSQPFKELTATRINQELKRIAPNAGFTTYSFRRCFMHRAIHHCGGNFSEAARKYTMHSNPKILEAFYVSPVRFAELPCSEH